MAYIKMTDEELKTLGINGQNSGYLNKSTGSSVVDFQIRWIEEF